jgi:AcrR family transcriptional regulator
MSTSIDKLIETTQELLWERGYVGMSPRAIQDRAGVGQGSMYHHFRSRRPWPRRPRNVWPPD